MTYRYLLFVWNALDPRASEAAQQLINRLRAGDSRWKIVIDDSQGGLVVCHADATERGNGALLLNDSRGVVLGTLFSSKLEGSAFPRKEAFDSNDAERIVGSSGRSLFTDYWGRYVAVVRDRDGHSVHVLRDPSGGLPCFFVKRHGLHIFFSDIEDLLRLEPLRPSINWAFIRALVSCTAVQPAETGLNEVQEIASGGCVTVGRDTFIRELYWDPLQVAQQDMVEDADEAAARLRTITRACVHAWVSCHDSIVHRLSGGLDSSIVLSCLAEAPNAPAITCVNYFSAETEEDERMYAQLAAQKAGCELVEYEHDVESVQLENILNIARSPRPWFYLYPVEFSRIEAQLAASRGATALFSGVAGDGIFYQARAGLAVRDFVRHHGLTPGLASVALDAARIERTAVWPLLWDAVRSRFIRRSFDPAEGSALFASEFATEQAKVSAVDVREHPWLQSMDSAPHGKAWHVMTMATMPPYYDPLGKPEDPENVSPLVSQPIMELCLRIPTYVLIKGGRDRAIARRAFQHDVPSQIIRRRDKGASMQHARRVFDRNIPFIRWMLLDGVLIREGLLDRAKVEQCLKPSRSLFDGSYLQLLIQHLSTEAWLTRWLDERRRIAA